MGQQGLTAFALRAQGAVRAVQGVVGRHRTTGFPTTVKVPFLSTGVLEVTQQASPVLRWRIVQNLGNDLVRWRIESPDVPTGQDVARMVVDTATQVADPQWPVSPDKSHGGIVAVNRLHGDLRRHSGIPRPAVS